eukprot:2761471-Pleurochrysis_carterae.AAC.1
MALSRSFAAKRIERNALNTKDDDWQICSRTASFRPSSVPLTCCAGNQTRPHALLRKCFHSNGLEIGMVRHFLVRNSARLEPLRTGVWSTRREQEGFGPT